MHRTIQRWRSTVIQDKHPESIHRIIYRACSASSVQNQIIVLATASDKHVGRRYDISPEPQLLSLPWLNNMYRPDRMEHDWYGNANLNGDENPSCGKHPAICILSPQCKVNAKTKVKSIRGQGCYRQEAGGIVYVALPGLHEVNVVSLSQHFDRMVGLRQDGYAGVESFGRGRSISLMQSTQLVSEHNEVTL